MIAQLLAVLKHVLTNNLVIICAVIVFLYVDFVWFVARYRKKPSAPKSRPIVRAPEPEAAPAATEDDDIDEE